MGIKPKGPLFLLRETEALLCAHSQSVQQASFVWKRITLTTYFGKPPIFANCVLAADEIWKWFQTAFGNCWQLEDSKLVIKIVDASNPVALIKTFIKIPPERLVISNAVFHTGRLLHALLWAHSQASVLPISWSRNSGPLGLIPISDLPRLVSRYNRPS